LFIYVLDAHDNLFCNCMSFHLVGEEKFFIILFSKIDT